MTLNSFSNIEQHLADKNKVKAAFVAPSDMVTLRAVLKATKNNLIDPIFIGDEKLILKKASEQNIDISCIEILDFEEPYKALETASMLAGKGEIDLIIKGKYHPSDFIEKLFHDNTDFCDLQKVHHIALTKTKEYDKFLFISDALVHCQPDMKIKSSMIDTSVQLAKQFGIACPKVALLAAVEVVYKQMPVTVEAAELQAMYENQKENCVVEGPISFDVAIDKDAAIAKGLTDSIVAGDTDIMIAPDIGTANGIYKAMSMFADAEIGGFITGGKVPVVTPLDVDSVETRYNSILLSLMAN